MLSRLQNRLTSKVKCSLAHLWTIVIPRTLPKNKPQPLSLEAQGLPVHPQAPSTAFPGQWSPVLQVDLIILVICDCVTSSTSDSIAGTGHNCDFACCPSYHYY